jgi:EAL domain-containing protein (putative c-di-GMP-specific phosphodiesterase class I)
LTDDGLPADVERLLHKHGITPEYLTFEITETSVMADADQTNGVLHRLRALGVRLSIDDFGTGYSSLVYLKRLAVDELKVDQSFVRDMTRDANDWAIVRSTLEMAHHLGLSVVAEGIEDAHTCHALREMGCDVAQGYFLSRPLPAGQIAACVRTTESSQASFARHDLWTQVCARSPDVNPRGPVRVRSCASRRC